MSFCGTSYANELWVKINSRNSEDYVKMAVCQPFSKLSFQESVVPIGITIIFFEFAVRSTYQSQL